MANQIKLSDALKSFSEYLTNEGKSELTVKNYVSDVCQFQRYCASTLPTGAIVSLSGSAEVVKVYVQQLKKAIDVKPTTTNRKIVSLRQFFHFCSIDATLSEEVPNDPMVRISVGKIQGGGQHAVKWLKREDIDKILSTIPIMPMTNKLSIARNHSIILILVNCGLRVGELSELRIGDINFETGVLTVRNGKGGKHREVPITNGTLGAVREWLEIRRETREDESELKAPDYMFISERAAQLSDRGVQHICQVLSGLSGIQFSPHTLRHTYCKNIADATGKLEVVASLAGHSNINTTRIYTSPSMEEMKKVVEGVEFK